VGGHGYIANPLGPNIGGMGGYVLRANPLAII
jgi:hypothetical protein